MVKPFPHNQIRCIIIALVPYDLQSKKAEVDEKLETTKAFAIGETKAKDLVTLMQWCQKDSMANLTNLLAPAPAEGAEGHDEEDSHQVSLLRVIL